MELCRVCMRRDTEMSQLFDSNSDDETIIKIQFCTGVLFTKMDMLPSKICTKCLEDLNTAHNFKIKCLNSEQLYRDLVIVKIKAEPQDNGDVNLNKGTIDVTGNDETVTNNDEKTHNDVFNDDDVFKEEEEEKEFDFEYDIKVEDTIFINTRSTRKGNRVRFKTKEENSITIEKNTKSEKPVKGGKLRGPYKKADKQPGRLAKLKFRKLFCEVCNLKFTSKADSDVHKKEVHNEPHLWICEICGKSFVHRSSQYSHMRVHYPPQHACDHCDYKTANKHDLIKHLRIHSGNKSYICPVCAAAYRTSSNLHAHVRLKHERLRRHACSLCARTFCDRTKLNRHMDSHNDVKRYSCEVCHSYFTRRCYWKKHLQKQHDIVIPSCRPGRPRTDIVLSGEKEDK